MHGVIHQERWAATFTPFASFPPRCHVIMVINWWQELIHLWSCYTFAGNIRWTILIDGPLITGNGILLKLQVEWRTGGRAFKISPRHNHSPAPYFPRIPSLNTASLHFFSVLYYLSSLLSKEEIFGGLILSKTKREKYISHHKLNLIIFLKDFKAWSQRHIKMVYKYRYFSFTQFRHCISNSDVH
jgi:hypothetical protein